MNAINEFEIKALDFIRENFSCGFLDLFFKTITKFSNAGIGWIILAIALLCFKKTRKTGCCMAVALVLGLLIGNLTLKPLIGRIRPYDVNTDITLIIKPPSEFSFPSGHTLCSVECAVAIFLNNKKWGVAALSFALLTALSRLYLYVHYPTDILAGALLGIANGLLACFIIKKVYEYIDKRKLSNN